MGYNYGSIWRKWDFHIHTPYSILNNNFGFNPFEVDDAELETLFDEYVIKLFTAAVENNIVAIGITDYFMLEGYKRIKNEYLSSPEKMEECFPNEALRKKIEKIYVFPNIELRLDTFVGKQASSVNYHVIFSNDVDISDIEENFLHQLVFKNDAGSKLPLTISNIQNFGKKIKDNNGNSGSDLLVGLENVTVSYDEVWEALKKSTAFSGRYLIMIPVDEDLSQIAWSGRDYSTRLNLYKQAHIFLTANEKTVNWALAKGREADQIREFGSIKPCVWGSDAHEYERMFKPDFGKTCWIKAEPTFDGLMQIVYEPGERVRIQPNQPEEKDSHQIIDNIVFDDDNFQTSPVVFNNALTCIIGGKSTGKSLLLRQIAHTIDPEYVESQERIGRSSRKPLDVRATVTWKDGTTGGRKIVYIPQTFLNKTIDNPEEATAINKIIEVVLLQEPEIQDAFDVFNKSIEGIKKKVQIDIQTLIEKLEKLRELEEEIKKEGLAETFKASLRALEEERTELAKKVDISQEEIDRFRELEELLQNKGKELGKVNAELTNLEVLSPPSAVVPGYFQSVDGFTIKHDFSEGFPKSSEKLTSLIVNIDKTIIPIWNSEVVKIREELVDKRKELEKEQNQLNEGYAGLKSKVDQSEQLQKITMQIADENDKLQKAKYREEERQKLLDKISTLRTDILNSQTSYFVAYSKFSNTVRETGTKKDTALVFDAKVVWKQRQFMDSISTIFNNKNFSPFRSKYEFDLSDLKENDYSIELLDDIWKAMDGSESHGRLAIKSGYNFEMALEQLFKDWYNIHYVVTSGNDAIEEMSPGKKALVLLELLISLEDSKCPILIDQPEDDLDNRSIYNDLVQFLKRKKKERQIIIVTHNANVVLGADAEEVIVANQDGKDTKNTLFRFEYRSGAIENDEIPIDSQGNAIPGILNKSGIQTQICDILEGGKNAFKLRQNKYTVITQ